jgi:hypothetical protein
MELKRSFPGSRGTELRPPMAVADVLHAHLLSHRIKWQPNRAHLIAADRPIWLVLMPWYALRGSHLIPHYGSGVHSDQMKDDAASLVSALQNWSS